MIKCCIAELKFDDKDGKLTVEKILDPESFAYVIHAHWTEEDDGWGDAYWVCSNCKEPWWLEEGTPEENGMSYCPKCGARMDEAVDNG